MQQLYKYPHTPHVPWSPGTHNDDVKLSSTAHLTGKEVVASEKMDGENCLDGSTIVETPAGARTIAELCTQNYSGEVLSHNVETGSTEFKAVEGCSVASELDDWYEIESEGGKRLLVTGSHLIWMPVLRCYRRVRDLVAGDEILLRD